MSQAPYYASRAYVFKHPTRNPKTGGMALGFRVLECMEEPHAELVAAALNLVTTISLAEDDADVSDVVARHDSWVQKARDIASAT